jgi:hypothetical protein
MDSVDEVVLHHRLNCSVEIRRIVRDPIIHLLIEVEIGDLERFFGKHNGVLFLVDERNAATVTRPEIVGYDGDELIPSR